MKKWLRDFAKNKALEGWVMRRTSNGHFRFKHDSGAIVIASSTPSCPFALHKVEGDMRRALAQKDK